MSIKDSLDRTTEAIRGARGVAKHSFKSLFKSPQIVIYPYLAAVFVLLSSPFISALVIKIWNSVHPTVISEVGNEAPHILLQHLGLVAFSVYYANFVTSYFICAISATTLAKLEDQPTPALYGLQVVLKNFLRVTLFALVSIFFFPLGIISQRKKLPKGIIEIMLSSFSLSMAQLAPAVISEKRGIFSSIQHCIEILGKASLESLVIRIGTFGTVLLLGSISFLPKLLENLWFNSATAHAVGWIITGLLGLTSYVVLRVISTVFTTTLYYHAKNKK